jgi:hypothetical protein
MADTPKSSPLKTLGPKSLVPNSLAPKSLRSKYFACGASARGFTRRFALMGAAASAAPSGPAFPALAARPPMGWNSWDSFATTITEAQVREVAPIMARRLRPHGYRVFTIDIQWYEPGAVGFEYRAGAPLTMDEWGRLLPAPNRFPSAAGGAGFKPIADYLHRLGLDFGVHLMRGVPRQAVERNLPVKNTDVGARDIADVNSICPWNSDMYGVDMSKPGAQAYYDSVFQLFAAWGVDFVKVDDMARPYFPQEPEIEAVHRAIINSGRPMTLSLSPGETPLAAAAHVCANANMWRISDDFWDSWRLLKPQFERLHNWTPYRREGHWPDADMLPFGMLDLGRRASRLTREEQITCMTLWCMARSPLIMGGDLRRLDDFTGALITNDEMLAVNQHSLNNRQLMADDDWVVWIADLPGSPDKYVAVFNLKDTSGSLQIDLKDLGFDAPVQVRDLWARRRRPDAVGRLSVSNAPHASCCYRLSLKGRLA